MCGISGILDFNLNQVNENSLKKMDRAIIHRGPDDEGIFREGNIGLRTRRLSIIDLAGGHQPIRNEDKTLWITYNGEIYNFIELKKNLLKKGHRFYTRTDTEVILHLYEEYGEKCLEKLEGMFAFAIWNREKRELFLARDPMGEKPLFWTVFDHKLIFSSEIKGILSYPGFIKEVEEKSLANYFLYGFVPAPQSIFKGIRKVLPGYFVVIKEKEKIREEKYWEIDYSQKLNDLRSEEIKERAEAILEKAVGKMLMADVSLGVCLSGGVDSSLVTAMMAKKLGSAQVSAFTIGFKEKSFDESDYARAVAKYLGVKHYLKNFSHRELFNLIPKVAEVLDEPMTDPSILPTHLLSAFVREKVKVVLSGDGGDESFAGYPKYLAHLLLKKTGLEKLPISYTAGYRLGKFGRFLSCMSYPLYLRNQLWINNFSAKEVELLTGIKTDFSDIEKYHQIFNGKDILDEAFFLDQKLTLTDLYLVKVDRASMANSLEVRCPFLDKKLVELCASIPFNVKLKGFKTKSLLKEIALKYLPEKVVNRPKRGFGIPLEKWLGNELRPLVKKMILEKKEKILSPKKVEKIMRQGTNQQIWSLLIFNLWKEKWLKN